MQSKVIPMKKRLTQNEEFEIMKIVLDKMILLGILIIFFGIYKLVEGNLPTAIGLLSGGSAILVLFVVLMIKEYEVQK
jgi:hypothetical protein